MHWQREVNTNSVYRCANFVSMGHQGGRANGVSRSTMATAANAMHDDSWQRGIISNWKSFVFDLWLHIRTSQLGDVSRLQVGFVPRLNLCNRTNKRRSAIIFADIQLFIIIIIIDGIISHRSGSVHGPSTSARPHFQHFLVSFVPPSFDKKILQTLFIVSTPTVRCAWNGLVHSGAADNWKENKNGWCSDSWKY